MKESKNLIQKTTMQKWIVRFVLIAYGGLLISSMVILLLQGFKAFGFNLGWKFLVSFNMIIGGVVGILVIVCKKLFK